MTDNKQLKYIDIIFLSLLFLIGILFSFGYGTFWDQETEQRIVSMNVMSYMEMAKLDDTEMWHQLIDDGVTPIGLSDERDHGAGVLLPLFLLNFVPAEKLNVQNALFHCYVFIICFLFGIVSLYKLAFSISRNRIISALTTLFLFLTPPMFAHMHYNNKDMVFLSLIIWLLYRGIRLVEAKNWSTVLLFSLAAALATNIKIVGAYYVAIIGVFALIDCIVRKELDYKLFTKIIICITCFAAFYIILTPAVLTSPGGFFGFLNYLLENAKAFSRWNNQLLYDGIIWTPVNNFTRKYLIKMFIITTPITVLFLSFCGGIIAVIKLIKCIFAKTYSISREEIYSIVMAMLGLLPLAYGVVKGVLVYNGWRHFYFTYVFIILFLLESLLLLAKMNVKKQIKCCLCVAWPLLMFVLIAVNYPNEHAYYNFLAGKNVEQNFELDYWGISVNECYDYILKVCDQPKITIGALDGKTQIILSKNYDILSNDRKSRIELAESYFYEADYVIISQVYGTIYRNGMHDYVEQDFELIKEIKSFGNTMYKIYRKPQTTVVN